MEKGFVLVVDDEANARNALAELLRDEGYRVESAADGFEALAKLEEEVPDVVLTDLTMPGMGGAELLERLRARDDSVAVVVMTAFGTLDTAADVMKKGAADYLAKPLHTAALYPVIAREIEHRRFHQAHEAEPRNVVRPAS
jgi:DNA-binding NtrC family response regulator